MRITTLVLAVLAVVPMQAQETGEKPVPKNEVRVQVPGCAYNRTFISGTAPAGEPVGSIQPGRRLKLNGPKQLLKDITTQAPSMVEITGRIRRADLDDLRGVPVGGGVRIGGGAPQAPTGGSIAGSSLGYYEVIIDVESFRLLPDRCPKR